MVGAAAASRSGIADAVTILADRASMADAAATIVGNAVDLPGHPNIVRVPACELAPDSDLGDRLVTQGVGKLSAEEISKALDAGVCAAKALLASGLIRSAALHLSGCTRIVDTTPDPVILSAASPFAREWTGGVEGSLGA